MKKHILAILLLVLLIPGLSWAKTYTLSLNVPSTTGVTQAPNGGTSPYMVDGVSASYDLYPQLDRTYAYGFQFTSLLPSTSQISAGGDWSGVSLSVIVKFKSESDDVSWDTAESHYLFKGDTANSAVTPQIRWIKVPPADRARVYLVSEGGSTVFGTSTAKLIASEIPLEIVEPVIEIAEGTFTMPANGSGVSQFTAASIGAFPSAHVGWGEFSVSGASRFFTTDGKTTPSVAGNGTGTHVASLGGFELSGDEIRRLQIAPSGTACNIHYRLMNRKP